MSKVIKCGNVQIGRGRPKICVSIMGVDDEHIISQIDASNAAKCDLIELRIDHYGDVCDMGKVKALLRKIKRIEHKPMIFTLRRFEEGGKISVDIDYYKQLIRAVAEQSLADIVDVEMSAIPENGSEFIRTLKDLGTYVILSKHDFECTPDKDTIISTYLEMEALGADIAKAAYMPNTRRDVVNLIDATEDVTGRGLKCSVVAISMGRLGTVTRIMGEFLESVITFASMSRASAPGQIGASEMDVILDALHSNYKKVILVGFIGTGKTAVANSLYNMYGLKRIDLNAYIENKEQTTISDMADKDIELFLDKETKYLKKVLKKDVQVISAGTGVALRKENIDLMKENGIIVLLKAETETISERLGNDPSRTTINDVMDFGYMQDLMAQTEGVYENIADLTISTDNKNIEQISKEIVETLGFTM